MELTGALVVTEQTSSILEKQLKRRELINLKSQVTDVRISGIGATGDQLWLIKEDPLKPGAEPRRYLGGARIGRSDIPEDGIEVIILAVTPDLEIVVIAAAIGARTV